MLNKKIRVATIGSNFGLNGLFPAFNSNRKCITTHLKSKDWKKLKKENYDAVAIAVPPQLQYTIAKYAIKNGLDVFAEKPLAANLKQTRELYRLAKKNRTMTCIDFMFTEIPAWKKVKDMLDKKTLGEVKQVYINWDWLSLDIKYKKKTWKTSVKEGGGILSFYFCHGFYYLEKFIGEIKTIKTKLVYSKESLNGAEVEANMQIKTKNGIMGNVHVCCKNRTTTKHQLIFECERGKIILEAKDSIVNNFIITITSKGKTRILKIKENKDKPGEDERVKIVRILSQRFIDSCISREETYPNFTDGLRVAELIDKARKNTI